MKIIKLEDLEKEFKEEYSLTPFAIPTETVYGLAARIDREDVLSKIYTLKGRPSDNPLIIHVSSVEMMQEIIEGEIPDTYLTLIKHFWPGPLSLIMKGNKNVSKLVYGNTDRMIAVRMPALPMIRRLIEIIGVPLAAPSANKSGRPSPTAVQHVINDFGEEIDVYIDGGSTEVGIESTVAGIVEGKLVIMRLGGITKDEIETVLGEDVVVKTKLTPGEKVLCPGQKYKHYSPQIPVYLFKGEDWCKNMKIKYLEMKGKTVGFLGREEDKECTTYDKFYSLGNNKRDITRKLFGRLIESEKECDVIFIVEIDLEGEGLALMDRIEKATSYVID